MTSLKASTPVIFLGLFTSSNLLAQNRDWADAGTAWGTTSNWTGGNVPDSAGENASFEGGAVLTNNPDTAGATIPIYGIDIIDGVLGEAIPDANYFTSFDITGAGNFDIGQGGLDIDDGAFTGLTPSVPLTGNRFAILNLDQDSWNLTADQVWYIGEIANVNGGGFDVSARVELSGEVTGTNVFVKEGNGDLYFDGDDPNPFSGKFIQNGGNTQLGKEDGESSLRSAEIILRNGTLRGASNSATRGSEQLEDTAIMAWGGGPNATYTLNELNIETIGNFGSGISDPGDRLILGNSNSPTKTNTVLKFGLGDGTGGGLDSAFDGQIGGLGTLEKSGTGTWTLAVGGRDRQEGGFKDFDVDILDGTFQMNAIHDDNVTGIYTISSGAELIGTGQIDGEVVLKDDALFSPGQRNIGGGYTTMTLSEITETTGTPGSHFSAVDVADTSELNINSLANTITTDPIETIEIDRLTMEAGSIVIIDINTSTDIDGPTAALDADVASTVTDIGTGITAASNDYLQTDAGGTYDQIVGDSGSNGIFNLTAGGTVVINPLAFMPAKGMVYQPFLGFSSIVANGFTVGDRYRSGSGSFTSGDYAALLANPTDAGGSWTSAFDLVLPDLTTFTSSKSLRWDTSLFLSDGILVIVPEPSRAMLLLVGVSALCLRRRR